MKHKKRSTVKSVVLTMLLAGYLLALMLLWGHPEMNLFGRRVLYLPPKFDDECLQKPLLSEREVRQILEENRQHAALKARYQEGVDDAKQRMEP